MPINRLLKEGNFTPGGVERLNRAFALAQIFSVWSTGTTLSAVARLGP